MNDPIHQRFVETQRKAAASFAASNPELCEIHALPDARFLVRFHCPVLIRRPGSAATVSWGCDVGITLGPDYLRRIDPGVATMLTPFVFHPNIMAGHICLGRISPATPLTDILVQLYEMIVWHAFTPHDCLNPDAAQWARNNTDRIPLETGRAVFIPKREEVAS